MKLLLKRVLAVFGGDKINLYNMKIPITELEKLMDMSWDFGTPSFISHDRQRPVGWSNALSLFFEPGHVRLAGINQYPESRSDVEVLESAVKASVAKRITDTVGPDLAELEATLRPYLLGNEKPYDPDCAALHEKGLATRAFPEIFSLKDKDGLIPMSMLNQKAPGVFEEKGLLFFASPYFRRSSSRLNSLNAPFLKRLKDLSSKTKTDVRVSLDEDVVGLASTFKEHIELEYWWGPHFSDDISKIKRGVTRHEADERERLFHAISRTEFWWYKQSGCRVFECEELRDIPSLGVSMDSFGCRYVHSLADNLEGGMTHLDGAIRIYDEESMIARLDADIKIAGRHSTYKKLWRVDGPLEISKWKELLTHFYRDNRLVGEYLGGEDQMAAATNIESAEDKTSPNPFTPINMKKGQGLRLSVTYRSRSESDNSQKRTVQPFDYFQRDNEGRSYFVESCVVEVAKLLKRAGEGIQMPKNVDYVSFSDTVDNLPLIMHTGVEAVSLANKTQEAIAVLCQSWAKNGLDRILSFNIGIQYENKDVIFSIAGHCKDLDLWFAKTKRKFPVSEDDMGSWCEQIAIDISNSRQPANDAPRISDILEMSGVLRFRRRFLNQHNVKTNYDDDKGDLIVSIEFDNNNDDLTKLLAEGTVAIAPAIIIKESTCSGCGLPYGECGCIKYIDPGVVQSITECKPVGFFITSRNA